MESLPAEMMLEITSHLDYPTTLTLCCVSRTVHNMCYDRNIFKRIAVIALYQYKYHETSSLDNVQAEDWEMNATCSSASSEHDSDMEEWWSDQEGEQTTEDEWNPSDWGASLEDRMAAAQRDRLLDWPAALIFRNLSARDSVRVAFTVHKASQSFNIPINGHPSQQVENWNKHNFISWLLHLMTLQHPSCLAPEPHLFQLLLRDSNGIEKERNADIVRNPSSLDYLNASYCIFIRLLLKVGITIPVLNQVQ